MDKRRVQETGRGTLFITLPKKWVKKHFIKKGSILQVEERWDGSLILKTEDISVESSEAVIKYRGKEYVEWGIIGAYLLGYDRIIVKSDKGLTLRDKEFIRKVVRKLIGIEIVGESIKEVKLQCIVDPSFTDPVSVFKRINSLTIDMVQNALSLVEKFDEYVSKVVYSRDDEVDRLYFLLIRILRSAILRPRLADSLNLKPINLLDYRVAAEALEKIGDYSVMISGEAARLKGIGIKNRFLKDIKEVLFRMQMESVIALLSEDVERISRIRELNRKLSDLIKELRGKLDLSESGKLILQMIERIGELCIDISDLVVPRELIK